MYNAKVEDIEDKIPDFINLANHTTLKVKKESVTSLAKISALDAKYMRLKAKYLILAI